MQPSRLPFVLFLLAALCLYSGTALGQPGSPPPTDCSEIPADGYHVEQFKAIFPQTLSLNSGHITSNRSELCNYTNTNKGIGVSISYFFEEALCSVYIYDKNISINVHDAPLILCKELDSAVGDLKEMVVRGAFSSVVPEDSTRRIKIHGHDFAVQSVLMTRHDQTQSESFIVVGIVSKNIVKLRITFRPEFNDISNDFLSAFALALGKILPG